MGPLNRAELLGYRGPGVSSCRTIGVTLGLQGLAVGPGYGGSSVASSRNPKPYNYWTAWQFPKPQTRKTKIRNNSYVLLLENDKAGAPDFLKEGPNLVNPTNFCVSFASELTTRI